MFCIIWMAWVSPTPETHKGLSKEERLYLERTVPTVINKSQVGGKLHSNNNDKKKKKKKKKKNLFMAPRLVRTRSA